MADYIDKPYMDKILKECKYKGELSNEAIRLFSLLARELSTSYNYKSEDEREDCIAFSIKDFANYWKGWQINPICKLIMLRNFEDGEKIEIVVNGQRYNFVPKHIPTLNNHFGICKEKKETLSINRTLSNLNDKINNINSSIISSYPHKVTKKINILDSTCEENSNGIVYITKVIPDQICKADKSNTTGVTAVKFENPPPAFNFMTSLARNGILKGLKKFNTDVSKLCTNFSEINKNNGGVYNS